jgi:hypothetical protein
MLNRIVTALALAFIFSFVSIGLPYSNIYFDDQPNSITPESIAATSDGGTLVAGSMNSGVGFIKLDANGNIVWQKGTFGGFGVVNSVKELAAGGFVATATIMQEIVAFRIDNDGNLVWAKRIETNVDTSVQDIIETTDGGFVLCGFINQDSTNYEGIIVKLDSSGNILWQKLYGGSGFDDLTSIVETTTGFVATGAFNISGIDYDLWFLQLDQDGNVVSSKTLGGSATDQGRKIIQAADGSFIIVGRTYSFGQNAPTNGNSWILKFDPDGNNIWQKVLGGDLLEDTYWIDEDQNGDLLIIGSQESFGANSPSQDVYFLRLDGTGNLIVFRSYGGYDNEDGAFAARQTDGKIAVASSNTTFHGPNFALWVFTIDGLGETDQECNFSETISTSLFTIDQPFVDRAVNSQDTTYVTSDFQEWIDQQLTPLEACQSCPKFSFDPPFIPDGELGVLFSTTISASGGAEPYTYFMALDSTLPNGLSLNPDTGVISGTPTLPGFYFFIIGARDSNGCASLAFYPMTINGDICAVFKLSPDTLAPANIGEEYNQQISTNGTPPFSFNLAEPLPDGLFLTPEGLVTGVPTTQGTTFFEVQAFDANFCFAYKIYNISVSCPQMSITPTELPEAQTDTFYSVFVTASGGVEPYSFRIASGAMEPHMIINSETGEIVGIPTIAGSYTFTVAAYDQTGCAAVQEFTLEVSCGAIEITPEVLPSGTAGNSYNEILSATGGAPPYMFSLESGSLPDGLILTSDGTLSGIPTAPGVFNFDIRVDDVGGCIGHRSYTLEIVSSCLLCDDFEDGILNPNWNYVKPLWKEKGGFLQGMPVQNRALALTGNAFAGCLECSIQTEVKMLENDGTLSILGWFIDKDNYIELIAREEANRWVLKQHSNGIVITKAKGKKNIQTNHPYTVRIEFDGSVFRVFVDDLTNPLFIMSPAAGVNAGQAGFEAKNTGVKVGSLEIK